MFMIIVHGGNSLSIPCLFANTREELVDLLKSHGIEMVEKKNGILREVPLMKPVVTWDLD